MNPIIASVLAAGERVCQFLDGFRRDVLADLAGEPSPTALTN